MEPAITVLPDFLATGISARARGPHWRQRGEAAAAGAVGRVLAPGAGKARAVTRSVGPGRAER